MGEKGSRWTARDWADALVARDMDQLQWMSGNEQARKVVNDQFVIYVHETPLEWAIGTGVDFERIRFLVEQVGAWATNEGLNKALAGQRWDLVDYLHAKGARYQNAEDLALRLDRFSKDEEEGVLELMYQYPHFWNEMTSSVARHRKKMTRDTAIAIMTAIKKRELACKDMYTIIAKMILKSKPSRQWGYASFAANLKEDPLLFFYFCFLTVLLLSTCFLICIIPQTNPSPLENCTNLTCAVPHKWLGPPGPPGAPGPRTINGMEAQPSSSDFVITKGAGITFSKPEDHSWVVPGKCFSFQSGNKTKP